MRGSCRSTEDQEARWSKQQKLSELCLQWEETAEDSGGLGARRELRSRGSLALIVHLLPLKRPLKCLSSKMQSCLGLHGWSLCIHVNIHMCKRDPGLGNWQKKEAERDLPTLHN